MRAPWVVSVLLSMGLFCVAAGGCSGGGGSTPDVGTDARAGEDDVRSMDARGDAAAPLDAAPDAALDVPASCPDGGCPPPDDAGGPDTAADAELDAAADVAPDAAPEVDVALPCPDECCADDDCDDGDPCSRDRCAPGGICAFEPYDCEDGDPCTEDVCAGDGTCTHEAVEGCCPLSALFAADFDGAALDDVAIEDRARNTRPQEEAWDQPVVWVVDTARAHGGRKSLYAGSPLSRTYDNGRRVSTVATTDAVALPTGQVAELRFWTWMDVETTAGYDALNVSAEVLDADGGVLAAVPLWTKPADVPMGTWRPVAVDLSALAGETVRIAFVFDTIDGSTNRFEGVYVDDVVLGTRCEIPACAADDDCDDGLPCTADGCEATTCVHAVAERCCLNAIDCHDADACTTDVCVPDAAAGACAHAQVPVENCCNEDQDCDDGDACTSGRCEENGCVQIPSGAPDCCEKDEDCLDDDPCTEANCGRATGVCVVTNRCECRYDVQCLDADPVCTRESCADGACLVEPTLRSGCCSSEVFLDHFEDVVGSGSRWTFANGQANVGWNFWDGPASTSRALYYGNPTTGSYASGTARNHGTATTRAIPVPTAVQTSLSFDLYLAVEAGTDHDTFSFSLLSGGDALTIFQKDFQTQTYTWQHVQVDLSGFAGRTVQFRFAFDTEDGEGNDGEGVFVDEFAVVSTCRTRACDTDANCYDGFGATSERCVAGVCQYRVSDELCDADTQCSDGDACTRDVCDLGGCVYRPIPGCCRTLADCDDEDVCTEDSCAGSNPSLCLNDRIPGCCEDVSDCDDGNPCTEDVCTGFGAFCDNPWIDGCCLASSQCDDDDDCTIDLCAANACEHVWACCDTDEECDDGDELCTADTCVDGRCLFTLDGQNPDCCTPEPLRIDFEDGTSQGFALATGTGGSAWRILSAAQGGLAHDGSYALYFGDSSGVSYADDQLATATSPPIGLPAGQALTLRFWTWVDTEIDYDGLDAYLDTGGRSVLLDSWTGSRASWEETVVDLSYLAGGEARLRFVFSSDGSYAERGVFVDGVVLESACAPAPCTVDRDCASATGCIEGQCVVGGCRYEVRSDCCETAADCDDLNACTSDRCENDVCTHSDIAGCCRSASDCGDGVGCVVGACVQNRCQQACDPDCEDECCLRRADCDDADRCTVDLCSEDYVCAHLWACCDSDGECDDGDDVCTTDRCVQQFCQFEIDASNPDCCQPEPYRIDFEDGTTQGFTSSGGAGGDAWHVATGETHSGSHALVFNGPGGTYHTDSVGVAEGPAFDLPAGQALTLSFWMKVDTESGFDSVSAELVGEHAGASLGVWEGTSEWFEVTEDVSFLGGESVRLRLAFTSDGSVNYSGVYVDDVAVTSACAPPTCQGDADCTTPTGCIEGRCAGGVCVFQAQPDCCQLDAECDDGNPCTLNRCVANRCEFPGDPADPGCCRSDEECDDGAPCTEERCVNSHCTRQCPSGCGYAFPYAEDFDSATTLGTTCWTTWNVSGGGTSAWFFLQDGYDLPGPVLSFDAYESTATGSYLQCVRSPTIDATFATTARLRFDHFGYSWDSGFSVKARVSSDGGATWQDVWSRTVTSEIAGPTDIDVFSRVGGSATVRIALCVASDGSSWFPFFGWSVDNVRLEGDVYRGDPPTWTTEAGDWLAPIGAETRFPLAGSDPDGDPIAFRLGEGAPGFLTIDDAGDGTADLVAAPVIGDQGPYEVELLLADPWLETARTFPLTVTVPGAAPEMVDPGPQTVVVNTVLRVTLEATDADGDPLTFTSGAGTPAFATLRDSGAGSAWLTLAPRIADEGAHAIPLVLSDGTQNVAFDLPVDVVFPGDAAPLVEDFDKSDRFSDTLWTTEGDPASAANDWLLLPDERGGPGFAPTYLDVPLVDRFRDTLASPAFATTGLVDVRIRWATDFRDYAPFTAESPVTLRLLVSTDDGASWAPVWVHAESDGDIPWSTLEVNAPALDGASDARIAFRIEGQTSASILSWALDDVIVFGTLAP